MGAFDQRDGMFDVLRDGRYRLSPTAAGLLWFLLFHGIYDRGSKWFGHVDIRYTGQEVLTAAVCRNRDAIRTGLADLESNGFIRRYKRYNTTNGNRMPDGIELTTPDDFCYGCRNRGHNEDHCTEPMPENPA